MPAFVLDQSYQSGEDNDDVGNLRRGADNQVILGQSFTPSVGGALSKIELYLKKKGSPTGNIWVEIHADGADPTAAAQLGSDSANVDVAGLGAGFAYISFTFPATIPITTGTEYWILLYGDYTLAVDVGAIWATDTDASGGGYAGGIAGRFGNGSAAWEDISGYERLFKEYHDVGGGFFALMK